MKHAPTPAFIDTLLAGIKRQCPQCYQSPLLKGYLKPYAYCASCQLDFSSIRSDDAPAWLTLVIIGHLLACILAFLPFISWPDWITLLVLMTISIVTTLILLPISKGVCMAMIWWSSKRSN
jgi:uncharacterized protein (DUF983 family)